jgi:beta-lactam-binding protein with PASTA domain
MSARSVAGTVAALLLAAALVGCSQAASTADPDTASPPTAVREPTESIAAAAPVVVPDVVGDLNEDAEAVLSAASLHAGFSALPEVDHVDEGFEGYVVTAQEPAAGATVPAGTTVTLDAEPVWNAAGQTLPRPDELQVPDVVGMEVSEASQVLTDAGLFVTIEAANEPVEMMVAAQSLKPGTTVHGSTEIVLRLRNP